MMPLHYVRHNRRAVCSCSNGLRAGAASGRPTPKTEREREQERERERDQAAKLARAQGRVSDMADDCQQTHKRAGRQRACSTITAFAARRREAVVRQPAGGRKPLK